MTVVRLVFKNDRGWVEEIFEYGELLTPPNIALLLRRAHVTRAISKYLKANGTVTIEAIHG